MKRKLLAMLLVVVMVLGLLPTALATGSGAEGVSAVTEAADPITVYMFYADGNKIVTGKDGTVLNNVPVTVTDLDADGKFTMEEGFKALHETYHTNGAAGYEGVTWVSKFWSANTSMVSYGHNNAWVYSPQEEIFDGDQMLVFTYQDQMNWSDLYTYFDSVEAEATAGVDTSFTLNGYSFFGSGQIGGQLAHATAAPEGATIKVYDEAGKELTALATTVAKDGTFHVTFPEVGTYTVEANGVCSYTCTEGYYAGRPYTNAPVVPARCTVTVAPGCEHKDENKDKLCDDCGENLNRVPVLKEGVSPEATGQVVVGMNYDIVVLQTNQIFEDPDGDQLNYTSYWYVRSEDGGQTWSETPLNFPPSQFGFTTIQFTENTPGVYMYRFRASDDGGKTFSEDTWTLTLNVVIEGMWDVTFNVGYDMNYSSNSGIYPQLNVWKTAGITADGYDYVGTYEKNGETVYVTSPFDYQITREEGQWLITDADATYELMNYEPVPFTDSSFGKPLEEGEELHQSGDVVSKYAMYYATIINGRYSFRACGWNTDTEAYDIDLGGMSVVIPTDKNVDGGKGGGTSLYLRVLNLYTTTAKSADKKDYFNADSYYTDVVCPIMGCHATAGEPYVNDKGYTCYPYLIYAAGNACLYNYYAYPNNRYPFEEGYENWMFNRMGNAWPQAGYSTESRSMAIYPAVKKEFNVPATADFGLYYQENNFNTREMEPMEGYPVTDGNTKTYAYMVHANNDGNYTWRVTDTTGHYVTLTGWGCPDKDLTDIFTTAKTDKHYHKFDQLGTQTATRDEADLMVNVDPTGYTAVAEDETVRIRAYRFWQLINSDAGNIMVEPDFHHSILSGEAETFVAVDGGNTTGNWNDVNPNGTVIGTVYYDAVEVDPDNYGSHGGYFPATDPNRIGVYIVSDLPTGKATASIPRNGMEVVSSRPEEWDYNFDTWYYEQKEAVPVLTFTTKNAVTVEAAMVLTTDDYDSTLSAWQTLTAGKDGVYTVDLLPFRTAGTRGGTVIIRMTDDEGNVSYQSVRVAEVIITAVNVTNPGEPFMPGNQITLTFDGMYRGIHKVSGIFNPTTFKVRYSVEGESVDGQLGQYQKLDRASITLTIPENLEFPAGEDTMQYVFDNGYTYGSMYSAANPFAFIYNMTDTGVGTNFNAVTVNYSLSKYADAVVTVEKSVYYKVRFQVTDPDGAVEGYALALKDAEGNVLTANEDGTYTMGYGKYTYDLSAAGRVRLTGEFRLGQTTEQDNGNVTWSFLMEKAAANAWDGTSATEPKKDENNVYLISNGAELAWVAQQVNASAHNADTFRMTADIDLAGYEWPGIGTGSSNAFTGRFDGNGFRVYNMVINYNGENAQSPYVGLFGYVNGGTVENLMVEGSVTLTSTKSVSNAYSAGVVGYAATATLRNLTNWVPVTVNRVGGNWSYVGGVVGYADDTVMTNLCNQGEINGYCYVGGVAGGIRGSSSMTECSNEGTVTAENNYAGGLASLLQNGSVIRYSVNSGTVNGNQYIAGLVGYIGVGASNIGNNKVIGCYNTGAINGTQNPAGLIGYLRGDYSTQGTIPTNNTELTNCYSTGTVTGSRGGAVGQMNGRAVMTNVYYLDTSAEYGVAADSTKEEAVKEVYSKSLSQMQDAAFVEVLNGEDETAPFVYCQGTTPILSWQNKQPVVATTLTVESVSQTLNAGEEVTVAVKISENTGFSNFELYIDYEHTMLELKSINTAAYYEALDMEVPFLPNFLTDTTLSKQYQGKDCGFITVASGSSYNKDGTLFTLTFTAKRGTDGGDAVVRVLNGKFNLVNEEGQDVALNPTLVDGKISVAESRIPTYTVQFLDRNGNELNKVDVEEDNTVAADAIPEAPAVERYEFRGWQAGETRFTAEQIAKQKVNADVTYTAAYEKLPTDVTLTMSGTTKTTVDAETVSYTISATNVYRLANVIISVKLDEEYVTDPQIELEEGWALIATTYENGILKAALWHKTPGDSSDGALMKITASTTSKIGTAEVRVTDAELTVYEECEESFVKAIFDNACVRTLVDCSIYDVNRDGVVNLLDVTRAQRYYGTDNAIADVDRSGSVDVADLILILNQFM